jgi:Zn-dependent protease with chaperone function
MRKVLLAVITASACVWSQSSSANDTAEFLAAKKAVEMWMGRPLMIDRDTSDFAPREARFAAGSIVVSTTQLRSLHSSQELAEFLAHAAAHARLGHPERLVTLSKAIAILGPDRRAAGVLQANTLAEMEKAVEPVAAELMETAGCAPGSCAMFGLVLRGALRP